MYLVNLLKCIEDICDVLLALIFDPKVIHHQLKLKGGDFGSAIDLGLWVLAHIQTWLDVD